MNANWMQATLQDFMNICRKLVSGLSCHGQIGSFWGCYLEAPTWGICCSRLNLACAGKEVIVPQSPLNLGVGEEMGHQACLASLAQQHPQGNSGLLQCKAATTMYMCSGTSGRSLQASCVLQPNSRCLQASSRSLQASCRSPLSQTATNRRSLQASCRSPL